MRIDILGQERRRRWRDEQKLEIVMQVGLDGATVTEVAQQHDLNRQQIYAWRSELKKKGLLSPSANAMFVPVDMSSVQAEPRGHHPDRTEMIELRLACGRSLCFGSGVDTGVLTRLIRAVEAA
ncbi:transposase [Ensifer canadensis]|uniref:IS66-like element accessory protein TnpA n=1 Tax=Ensifer canadensis TaxID=555315 RepID=UPI0035E3DBE4